MRVLRKAGSLLVVLGALVTQAQVAPAIDPTIQVDFSNPGLSPSHWTLILHPNGAGHFRSPTGKLPDNGMQTMSQPAVDRDIQVSPVYANWVFAAAKSLQWFNEPCESHLKVAFQGWKTLTYTGPQARGSCSFNYSRNKGIQELGDSLQAVAETLLAGARLELLLVHDKLGLDAEMEFLAEAVSNGQAQQICAIRGILEQLSDDDTVMERVRKRARTLLDCQR